MKSVISTNLEENISYIKKLLEDTSDIVYRQFYISEEKAALIYIDGMADKILLDNFILKTTMIGGRMIDDITQIKDRILAVSDIKEVKKLNEALNSVFSGDTIMFLDGMDKAYVIATRSWPTRGVSEPSGETAIRGGRDGLTETIRFNTALVRRRIKDPRLKIKPKVKGTRSKTDVAIMYIEDIVNKSILEELEARLDKINIDAVFDSGYIEQLVEDNKYTPFPQIQSTERPDVVAAALYEGRIAILVDNSPFAIIVPATLPNLFQSPDDYYMRWVSASLIRFVRLLAIITALVLPALYVAVTSFHTAIIPTKFAYSIAASREGVPFPAFVETLIMEVSLAFLVESVVRLPKAVGSTIGIVGGLIIGQSAVSAGIVSPVMIIIVSITSMANFIAPSYEVGLALRLVRFLLIIAASIIGLYGIMLGLVILLIHLVRLKSFGVPYLSPLMNPSKNDMKDVFIRAPLDKMKRRPRYMNTGDKVRQTQKDGNQ